MAEMNSQKDKIKALRADGADRGGGCNGADGYGRGARGGQAYRLAASGIVIALYVVIMYFSQSFAFGAYQVRLATALYALAYIHPYLVLPLGLANSVSNMVLGGLGPFDIIGGLAVGLLTAGCCAFLARRGFSSRFCAAPIILIPGLGVATWLSYLLGLPYAAMAASLVVGQIIPGILGVLIIRYLKDKI